jgi:FlaA1/EpsC-like NDP-sugar epimerase
MQLEKVADFIEDLEYTNIILYGIGQFAYKVIRNLEKRKNVFYVDGDPRNGTKTIFGNKIYSPSELPNLCIDNSCIVITSLISSESIKKSILNIFSQSQISTPDLFEINKII